MRLSPEDRAWAKDVKERANYTCARCFKFFPEGNRRGLHAHHIFTRTRRATRHDVENGVALCYGDHRWAHGNPLEFHDWIADVIGQETYDDLQARSRRLKRSGT